MNIGRRVYYETSTGNVIVDTCDKSGAVRSLSVEEEIAAYKALAGRARSSFQYIDLAYGQHAQEFRTAAGYRVNPQTKMIEFTYPEPEPVVPDGI